MCKRNERLGSVQETLKYGDVTVLEYADSNNVTIRFNRTGTVVKTKWANILSDTKDYNQPTLWGVGIYGEEKPTKTSKAYKKWNRMLERVCLKKKNYEHCSISKNFMRYSYFKDWCQSQVGYEQDGWHLDKDILVKGNKLYSEDTCCFVPQEINGLFTLNNASRGDCLIGVTYKYGKYVAQMKCGVIGTYSTEIEAFYAYKKAKEARIKAVANKWKDQIDVKVYEALMNWTIEIDD